jgi:tRNA U34 5-carboxymethylaminomethyl modifying GTPase MnmE/TrmE
MKTFKQYLNEGKVENIQNPRRLMKSADIKVFINPNKEQMKNIQGERFRCLKYKNAHYVWNGQGAIHDDVATNYDMIQSKENPIEGSYFTRKHIKKLGYDIKSIHDKHKGAFDLSKARITEMSNDTLTSFVDKRKDKVSKDPRKDILKKKFMKKAVDKVNSTYFFETDPKWLKHH